MSEVLLSAFNPSTMSPQLLEAIFVEREPLVQELLGSIRGSLSPTSKAHSLILGPRGMGKTHLVSLIYHRIREGKKGAEGLDEHLRIAWLREEERGIATFFHLLRRIIVVLAATYKDPELEKRLADLKGNSPQDTQVLAERLLVEWLDGKTLLLLVENFEDMLHRMGKQGQQAFRAFLQNRSCCLILATAPTLTTALSKQTAPFYNFFNLHTLEEFSVETARGLMRLIAEERGDKEFADFLETPVATERLRAIEDLAGGHPRIWILFAGFLTKEILDNLVPAFHKLMDELTPYYQPKMEILPPQEALIIEALCEKPGAMTVKGIAEATFLASNAVSSHLNDLAKRGYVKKERMGRESYYELREPLLRIWNQVKGEKNRPLRLIIEFIKRWFTIDEIKEERERVGSNYPISCLYFDYAINQIQEVFGYIDLKKDKMKEFVKNKKFSDALDIAKEIIKEKGLNVKSADIHNAGYICGKMGNNKMALSYYNDAIAKDPTDIYPLVNKANTLYKLGEFEESLECHNRIVKLNPVNSICWNNKGSVLISMGELNNAFECFEKSISLDVKNPIPYLNIWVVSFKLGNVEMATDFLSKALELYDNHYRFDDANVSESSYEGVRVLLSKIKNGDDILPDLHNILRVYVDHGLLGRMGEGLVQSIQHILSIDEDKLDVWLLAWQKVGAGYEELEIPLRVLAAAVEWKKTRSRAALLRLEPELRSKLESLLPPEASVVEAPRRKR